MTTGHRAQPAGQQGESADRERSALSFSSLRTDSVRFARNARSGAVHGKSPVRAVRPPVPIVTNLRPESIPQLAQRRESNHPKTTITSESRA
jgi:hypothetical protein